MAKKKKSSVKLPEGPETDGNATKTVKAPKAGKGRKAKVSKAAATISKKAKTAKPKMARAAKPKVAKTAKVKKAKDTKQKLAKLPVEAATETAQVLSSEVTFDGLLFKVRRDRVIEPGGKEGVREVIRHNGSVVILAMDHGRGKSKKDPWIVVERQYRHAANQFLWELPAGKLDEGEEPLAGAKRELEEETGYQAKKWKPLVEYYASPGFLGEAMKVFVAEGLVAGNAHPEEDEQIEIRLVKLSEVLKMIEKGAIRDGKTLTSVLLYARQGSGRRRK